jgi:hypothetical protein
MVHLPQRWQPIPSLAESFAGQLMERRHCGRTTSRSSTPVSANLRFMYVVLERHVKLIDYRRIELDNPEDLLENGIERVNEEREE